jgi:hypothetical protein
MKRLILLMICASIAEINLAQTGVCNITPISGHAYFSNECGGLKIQSVISLHPVPYGECGDLIFLPDIILPDNTSSVSDQREITREIRLYPNPVLDIINVEISGNETEYQISIFHSTGKLVYSNTHYNSSDMFRMELSTDALTPGLYFIRVYSRYGGIQSHKFIKI